SRRRHPLRSSPRAGAPRATFGAGKSWLHPRLLDDICGGSPGQDLAGGPCTCRVPASVGGARHERPVEATGGEVVAMDVDIAPVRFPVEAGGVVARDAPEHLVLMTPPFRGAVLPA